MAAVNKTSSRKRRSGSMRQSVSIPAPLAAEVRRVAKERHLTISRTLVTLAERGVRAEQEAQDNLKIAYRRFLQKQEPEEKEQAGKDLIRAIFGKAGIAEDTLL
jgi:predicted DNA-binding ribbon-helix-helix protein